MIKTLKIKLKPNNNQQSKMFQFAGAKRFAYNWALSKEQENYKRLYTKSNNANKQAIKDACNSYKRFFKGQSKFPKFKSKKHDRPSFYVDNLKIKFTNTHVKLENISTSRKKNKAKLNWIKLCEKSKIPKSCKYINPHVVYDGVNWFICVGIEYEDTYYKILKIRKCKNTTIDNWDAYYKIALSKNEQQNIKIVVGGV